MSLLLIDLIFDKKSCISNRDNICIIGIKRNDLKSYNYEYINEENLAPFFICNE